MREFADEYDPAAMAAHERRVDARDLRPSGSLILAAVLSAVAGFVDARVFLHVAQVFVANMSGNVILFGMGAGQRSWEQAGGPGVAIVAFVVGVIAGTALHDRSLERTGTLRPRRILLVEIGMLVALLALIWSLPDALAPASLQTFPALVVGGLAMGLQTTVIRQVGGVPIATTYESGLVASLGEEAALARERAARGSRPRTIRVLTVVLVSYAGGAAVAAALPSSPAMLVIPIVATAGVAIAVRSGEPRNG
jgi:uncharacterized membrane protein YoaK (UPF0700 family)